MEILNEPVITDENDLNDPVKNMHHFYTLTGATVPKMVIKHHKHAVTEYESRFERFTVNYDKCKVIEYKKHNVDNHLKNC